jgi:hypothetical protein
MLISAAIPKMAWLKTGNVKIDDQYQFVINGALYER